MTTQLAPASPLPPRPSDHAPPDDGLAFQWELLRDIAKELLPLFQRHHAEVEDFKEIVPCDPDWDRLFASEMAGALHILTVRSDGTLVGYAFLFVLPHLHSASVLVGQVERFYLEPDFRTGWTGVRLLKEPEARARELGAKTLSISPRMNFAKDRGTIGRIVERLGYAPIETVYAKPLE